MLQDYLDKFCLVYINNILIYLSVHQLNGVNRHQVSRLKRGTVLVNFVGFGNRFLFYLQKWAKGR
jgi:hypothetical protein